jgi:hypothetical protein
VLGWLALLQALAQRAVKQIAALLLVIGARLQSRVFG